MRRPRPARALALALPVSLAAAAAAGGCSRARTQLVVRIETNLTERDLPNLRMRCAYNWDGSDEFQPQSCDQPWHRGASTAEIMLPASFGLLAEPRRVNEPVTIVLDDTTTALRRVARVRFVPERTLQLTLALRAECRATVAVADGRRCPAGRATCTLSESCEAGGLTCGNDATCRPVDVGPEELTEVDAGAATPDGAAGRDAAPDAPADAAAD